MISWKDLSLRLIFERFQRFGHVLWGIDTLFKVLTPETGGCKT